MAKKQYYQNEDGDIICYTGKTPSKEDRTLVAEELHSGESKLKTINGQSLIGEGDIAVAAPVARTLKLTAEGMTDDGIWKLSESVAQGQLTAVEYDGAMLYPVPGWQHIFINFTDTCKATSENSMDVTVIIVAGNIAFEARSSFMVEVDAETGDARVVVDDEVSVAPGVLSYLHRLLELASSRSWPEPDESGWTPDRSLINFLFAQLWDWDNTNLFGLRSMLECMDGGLLVDFIKGLFNGSAEEVEG